MLPKIAGVTSGETAAVNKDIPVNLVVAIGPVSGWINLSGSYFKNHWSAMAGPTN